MEILENKIIRVLLIEDNEGDARFIQEQLKEVPDMSYSIERVSQLQEGLDYLTHHDVDIVLSDLSLPDSAGLETFKRLETEISTVPVIVLTGFDNKSAALQAVRDGAQDYLIKGQVEGKTLSRLILYAIERYHSQTDLRSLSLTDAMTGLHNRRGFITLGEQALKFAHRNRTRLCLFFADLDGLKQINDTYGHKEGDQAIIHTAQVLRKTFRETDLLARLGGDEFVILAAPDGQNAPEQAITRLQDNLKQHNIEQKLPYTLSISIGAAQFDPMGSATVEELLANADKILYFEKKERKGLKTSRLRKVFIPLGLATAILTALFFVYSRYWSQPPSRPVQSVPPVSVTPPPPAAPLAPPRERAEPEKPRAPKRTLASKKVAAAPSDIHQDLIPEDIAIVRFHYEQSVVSPGTSFGFDVNGSGFTPAFQQNLSVSAGGAGLQSKALHVITANHIHGEMVVPLDAVTQYVFPRIFLKNRPIFQTPQPFAVIRPGEVLDTVFTVMDEDGRGGRFRIFTNLTPEMAKRVHVKTNALGLDISKLEAHLPYVMEGSLRLAEGIDHGDYDLIVFLGNEEVFRKKRLLHIVSPNVGQTGLVQGLTAAQPNHRPGDNIELFLEGTGFAPPDIDLLNARVDEMDMGKFSFTFISPARIGIYFTIPKEATEGPYGILIEQNHQLLWRQKQAFTVVGPNWLAGLQMAPIGPGARGLLKLVGRDFSADFIRGLRLQADDPGIHLSGLRRVDASTLNADIEVDASVAPGDYMLDLTFKGMAIKLPGGSLITVNSD